MSQLAAAPRIRTTDMLEGYARGMFLMGERRTHDRLVWCLPRVRAILPLGQLHLPRRLARRVRLSPWRVASNRDFARTLALCRDNPKRADSWINPPLRRLYQQLHETGYAHSVECWHGERLVGGLFGVALGAAFFAEAMFHLETDASKLALLALHQHLCAQRFRLLDCQYQTPHLQQFGVQEIGRAAYQRRLAAALAEAAEFAPFAPRAAPTWLQPVSQTS